MKQTAVVFFIAVALLAVSAVAGIDTSYGYCVFLGDKDHPSTSVEKIYVNGQECERCFKGWVKDGGKACCPGDKAGCKGKTWITVSLATDSPKYYCPEQVEAHGWVNVEYKFRDVQLAPFCTVYSADGKVTVQNWAVSNDMKIK